MSDSHFERVDAKIDAFLDGVPDHDATKAVVRWAWGMGGKGSIEAAETVVHHALLGNMMNMVEAGTITDHDLECLLNSGAALLLLRNTVLTTRRDDETV